MSVPCYHSANIQQISLNCKGLSRPLIVELVEVLGANLNDYEKDLCFSLVEAAVRMEKDK